MTRKLLGTAVLVAIAISLWFTAHKADPLIAPGPKPNRPFPTPPPELSAYYIQHQLRDDGTHVAHVGGIMN